MHKPQSCSNLDVDVYVHDDDDDDHDDDDHDAHDIIIPKVVSSVQRKKAQNLRQNWITARCFRYVEHKLSRPCPCHVWFDHPIGLPCEAVQPATQTCTAKLAPNVFHAAICWRLLWPGRWELYRHRGMDLTHIKKWNIDIVCYILYVITCHNML